MRALPPTAALLRVAERVVWFRPPVEAVADAAHFLAHVMTYGSLSDVRTVAAAAGDDIWRQALAAAPPGVFDARSWAFWHLRCGVRDAPALPTRRLA